jgi:hypothetical protein
LVDGLRMAHSGQPGHWRSSLRSFEYCVVDRRSLRVCLRHVHWTLHTGWCTNNLSYSKVFAVSSHRARNWPLHCRHFLTQSRLLSLYNCYAEALVLLYKSADRVLLLTISLILLHGPCYNLLVSSQPTVKTYEYDKSSWVGAL